MVATQSCLLSWRLGAVPAAVGTAQPAFARIGGDSFLGDSKHDTNCCITLQAQELITSGNGINLSQVRDRTQTGRAQVQGGAHRSVPVLS